MQHNNHIHEPDAFEAGIKSKLENHSIPLDESVWQGIEQRLAPRRRRAVPLWWYALGGGVAASLALLLWLNPFGQGNENALVINNAHPVSVTEQSNTRPTDEKEQNSAKINVGKNRHPLVSKKHLFQSSKSVLAETKTQVLSNIAENQKPTTHSASDKTASTAFQANEVTKGVANSDLQKRDSIPAKKTEPQLTSLPEIPELLEDVKDNKTSKKKTSGNWLLAANIGSNGGLDLSTSKGQVYDALPKTAGDVSAAYGVSFERLASANNASVIPPKDFTNIQYLPPLSFGITLQKNLASHWSISSGLMYTYLRSNYSITGEQLRKAEATLDLHYLGIPMNVNYLIKETARWNFYLSAGGAIEKGIRSVYKQTIILNPNNGTTQQTNIYSKIEGVQTSVNGAFGVGYKLDKNFSLFFEPKIVYYFKNNQPHSARTETPLNVGFNGGLSIGL